MQNLSQNSIMLRLLVYIHHSPFTYIICIYIRVCLRIVLFYHIIFSHNRRRKYKNIINLKILFSDDFKCSLPDVTSVDTNLDITRFRTDFAKISEVRLKIYTIRMCYIDILQYLCLFTGSARHVISNSHAAQVTACILFSHQKWSIFTSEIVRCKITVYHFNTFFLL